MKARTSQLVLITFCLSVCLIATSATAQDLPRGLRNYQEVVSGKKKLEQLTPQEKQEVLIIHRRVQAQRYGSSRSPECRNALSQAENAASDLSDYARRLRNCADAQDYTDDCSSEFRRVRNAHSDYEDAVSSVSSYCS